MIDPEITDPRDPHKRPDIVAELDRWLAVYHFAGLVDVAVMQRARDEIVALRRYKLENEEALEVIRRAAALIETTPKVSEAKRFIRDEALEAAATVCLRKARDYVISIGQDNHHDGCISCAAAIRALKGKEPA